MEEEPLEAERRKLLVKSLPFMLNAAWEARSILSPMGLASAALSRYEDLEQRTKMREEKLMKSLAREVGHLDIKPAGAGVLSLSISRGELAELISNYLVTEFIDEGSSGQKLLPSKLPDYDLVLNLPAKSIFAKLVHKEIDQSWVYKETDKAERLNPSQVWIFACKDDWRVDIRFKPVFVRENTILHGRFRLLPVTDLLRMITKGEFKASIKARKETDEEGDRVNMLVTKTSTSINRVE
jgi:hypothetical protein